MDPDGGGFRWLLESVAGFTHPNTVKVFRFGELEDGSLYIVMEFLEGRNLNQVLRADGPLKPDRALPILVQAAGALDEAHRFGIIHRDLKPENIFICQQGGLRDYAKVLDFGLAKVTERQMQPGSIILTQEGMVFGTPEFMSPEQAQGKTLTPASDIYSLATILYEVMTGKLPFDAKNAVDFLNLHVAGTPIALNQRIPGKTFPPLLEAIIDRALAKRADDRFQTAADFGMALQAVLDGKTSLPPNLSAGPDLSDQKTHKLGSPDSIRNDLAKQPMPSLPAANALPAVDIPRPIVGRRPVTQNVGLLVIVAVAFLGLGIGLAVAVMKLVGR